MIDLVLAENCGGGDDDFFSIIHWNHTELELLNTIKRSMYNNHRICHTR